MEQHPVLVHLRELAALQVDSVNGFKQIAERVPQTALQDFFKKCGQDSERMVGELNGAIARYAGEAKHKGTLKGALNHLLLRLKADLAAADIPDLLSNIEICEELNLARYRHVLSDQLPAEERQLLEQQMYLMTTRLELLKNYKGAPPAS